MKRYESLVSLCFVLPRLTGYIIANPGTVEPSLHVKNIEVSFVMACSVFPVIVACNYITLLCCTHARRLTRG